MIAVGLDGCKAGWVAIALGDGNAFLDAWLSPTVEHAEQVGLSKWQSAAMVIDIPIGIPDRGPRQADVEARKFIGPRRNSVFPTPLRPALESLDYDSARIASVAASGGKSLSKQGWMIAPKILEVDRWVRGASLTVREGHPEVSFRGMASEPLLDYKKTLPGAMHRRALLGGEGVELPASLDRAAFRGVGLDDLHDAAAMAWTARRVALGEAVSIPSQPEVFSDGWPSAIWY